MPKTFKHLYPQICAYENLFAAFHAARKNGKRKKAQVAAFEFNLENELARLQQELTTKTFQPGTYHNFYVYERKRRKISAAPFRDRVAHHDGTSLTRCLATHYGRAIGSAASFSPFWTRV